MFIDFENAYDKIPRGELFEEMKRLGCGRNFLSNIIAMYRSTKLFFKSKEINANVGVKQGAATSGILFIIYIDRMIKLIKHYCEPDGSLNDLHVLLFMEGTVLLATTRDLFVKKFNVVYELCLNYGMKVNGSKTNYMVINSCVDDKYTMVLNSIKIEYSSTNIYT